MKSKMHINCNLVVRYKKNNNIVIQKNKIFIITIMDFYLIMFIEMEMEMIMNIGRLITLR